MSHDWGYKTAAKQAKGMGFGKEPARVTVKPHSRAPRSPKPPAPPPLVKKPMNVPVKKFAEGGPVKSDAKQDKALMARHNKLMHPGQKSKLNKGGAVKSKKGC